MPEPLHITDEPRPATPDSSGVPDQPSGPTPSEQIAPHIALPKRGRAKGKKKQRRIVHENSVLLMALAGGLLPIGISLGLLWSGDYTPKTQWTATIFIGLLWLTCGFAVRGMVVRPLQTLANMHAAIREGDFSMRGRATGRFDSLSMLMYEINALMAALREQKLGAMEAGALLNRVMAEIEVAVFAFDENRKLRVVNRAGERLLANNAERLLSRTADELGLAEALDGPTAQTLEKHFPGGSARWGMRRSTFRQGGMPHSLIVIADLSRALREEERQAWQRLVRVLGHELNNSLAPIRSIADSLDTLLKRQPRPEDWEDDLRHGLRIIADRSEALSRFMRDYARLTRLPQPQPQPVPLASLIMRIARLERRLTVGVIEGPHVTIEADPAQLEQVLINLIRNAVDATLEANASASGVGPGVSPGPASEASVSSVSGHDLSRADAASNEPGASAPANAIPPLVCVSWNVQATTAEVIVQDSGPGIANPGNLFVPFFTTKQGGSGIGLALSRQIAEAHGGTVFLRNREDARGAEAHVVLPLKYFSDLTL